MASAYKIYIEPKDVGTFHYKGYNKAAAEKVTEVLQHNLDNWRTLFFGLRHNHIVHCILSIYALGASAEEIQHVYDREASYQQPKYPVDEDVVKDMEDKAKFVTYLDQVEHDHNFLTFWQREIDAKGVRDTLEEHLFAGNDYANGLFARIFGSIWHAYLHLGYAFEFNQPAIVAEALAMTCIHEPYSAKLVPFFVRAEEKAGGPRQTGKKTLGDIFKDVRTNEILSKSIHGENTLDRSKNVADNAMDEIVEFAAQYSISEAQLQERLDEMVETLSLSIATKPSSINVGDRYKFDFFLLHSVNSLVLMPTLVNHKWISKENGIRLIEWAGRCHLLAYVAQTAPPITPDEVDKYPAERSWEEIFDRAINHPTDDGHLQKCIRSLAWGEEALGPKHNQGNLLIKPASWLKFANFVLDKVPYEAETSEQRWLLFF